jgi:hypothetical protein
MRRLRFGYAQPSENVQVGLSSISQKRGRATRPANWLHHVTFANVRFLCCQRNGTYGLADTCVLRPGFLVGVSAVLVCCRSDALPAEVEVRERTIFGCAATRERVEPVRKRRQMTNWILRSLRAVGC